MRRINLRQLKTRTGFTEYRIEKDMRLGLLAPPLPRNNTSENREWDVEDVERYERTFKTPDVLTDKDRQRLQTLAAS